MGSWFSKAVGISKSGYVRASAAGTVAFGYIGAMSDGFQYWTWVQENWAWLKTLSQSPYFPWGLALVLALIFVHGVRQAVAAESKNAAAHEASLHRETQTRNEALRPLMGVLLRGNRAAALSRVGLEIDAIETACSELKTWAEGLQRLDGTQYQRDGFIWRFVNPLAGLYNRCSTIRAELPAAHIGDPARLDRRVTEEQLPQGDPQRGSSFIFRLADNQDFMTGLSQNILSIEHHLNALRGVLADEWRALREEERIAAL